MIWRFHTILKSAFQSESKRYYCYTNLNVQFILIALAICRDPTSSTRSFLGDRYGSSAHGCRRREQKKAGRLRPAFFLFAMLAFNRSGSRLCGDAPGRDYWGGPMPNIVLLLSAPLESLLILVLEPPDDTSLMSFFAASLLARSYSAHCAAV